MQCHICQETFQTIPSLKKHIVGHFERLREKSTTQKRKLEATVEDDEAHPLELRKKAKQALSAGPGVESD